MTQKPKSGDAKAQQQPKTIDPVKAFLVAEAYHESFKLILTRYNDKTLEPLQPSIGIPQMMLVAFTCERLTTAIVSRH